MRRALSFAVLVAAVAVAVTGVVANGARRAVVAPTIDGFENVNFVSQCRFSHYGSDDPIVLPKLPGLSHNHTFFGADHTDAYSTPETLRSDRSTCNRVGDTAAYWAPTLSVGGKPVEVLDIAAYYRRTTVAPVKPFPVDFVMIGGNANATSPQDSRVVFWNCDLDDVNPSPAPVNCGNRSVRLHIIFPECSDGKSIDSANHKAHMAYSVNGACPETHPVAFPQLVTVIRYGINDAANGEVSSGSPYSGHADFVNAWDQAELTRLVDVCLNGLRPCNVDGP